MACFVLRRLGSPGLADGGAERALPGRRVLALPACLGIDGAQPRAALAGLLWSELDGASGRRNPCRELARLRDAGLEDGFVADADHLQSSAHVTLDAPEFAAACGRGEYHAALVLWHGKLLDGFALGDAPALADGLQRRWSMPST